PYRPGTRRVQGPDTGGSPWRRRGRQSHRGERRPRPLCHHRTDDKRPRLPGASRSTHLPERPWRQAWPWNEAQDREAPAERISGRAGTGRYREGPCATAQAQVPTEEEEDPPWTPWAPRPWPAGRKALGSSVIR